MELSTKIKRAAIYVRVSTQDQSCELQVRELCEFASNRGFQVNQIYEDKATGTNGNRPKLKELLADAKSRQFDVLLIWKLDRLFRSLKGVVTTLQELSDLGIDFISLKDQIDLTTATGRLMTHILGAFAEFEASMIRERVRAGLRNAKAKGKRLGRPITIDAQKVMELRARGLSLAEIARELDTTKSGVSKTLKRRATQVSKSINLKTGSLGGE